MRVGAVSDPAWPIVFYPGSGCLYTSKSVKLLWPGHKDEIAPILRLVDLESRMRFQCYHFATPSDYWADILARTRTKGVLGPKSATDLNIPLSDSAVQTESRADDFMRHGLFARGCSGFFGNGDGSRTGPGPSLANKEAGPAMEPA